MKRVLMGAALVALAVVAVRRVVLLSVVVFCSDDAVAHDGDAWRVQAPGLEVVQLRGTDAAIAAADVQRIEVAHFSADLYPGAHGRVPACRHRGAERALVPLVQRRHRPSGVPGLRRPRRAPDDVRRFVGDRRSPTPW